MPNLLSLSIQLVLARHERGEVSAGRALSDIAAIIADDESGTDV